MKKWNRQKKLISTLLICNTILTALLISGPIETFAAPEDGGVSPVNPLNPAITVEPTSPPKDSEPKSQKRRPAQTSKPTTEETNSSSTEIKKEEDKTPAIVHRKKKKNHNLNSSTNFPGIHLVTKVLSLRLLQTSVVARLLLYSQLLKQDKH